jgi:hypothetical protein
MAEADGYDVEEVEMPAAGDGANECTWADLMEQSVHLEWDLMVMSDESDDPAFICEDEDLSE